MNPIRRKILSIVLTVLQCGTPTLVGFGHTEFIPGISGSVPQIQSHDCGSREKHVPIGAEKQCLACQQLLQFVSAFDTVPICGAGEAKALPPQSVPFHALKVVLAFPERGPPALI